MSSASAQVDFEHLQYQAFSPLVRRYTWLRPPLDLILPMVLIASWIGDASRWRRGALVACIATLALVGLRESRYARRWTSGPIAANRLTVTTGLCTIGLSMLIFATGGLESPFLPILVLVNYSIPIFLR